MNPQQINLDQFSLVELTNMKEQAIAQIAFNIANAKVLADRQLRQDETLNANIVAFDEQIKLLSKI